MNMIHKLRFSMENLAEKTDFKRFNFALDRFNFFIHNVNSKYMKSLTFKKDNAVKKSKFSVFALFYKL